MPRKTYAETAAAAAAASPARRRCKKCAEDGITLVDLKCTMVPPHFVCKDCLRLKTKEEGWEEMYDCRACSASQVQPPTRVFVDHANLWIEAKKLGKKMKELNSTEDHRVRINYRNIRAALGQEVQEEKLEIKVYTSFEELHLPDSNELTEFSLEKVKVSKRNKQKMGDTKIVRDILHLLRTVPFSMRGTVILFSGDADMIPALEDVAKEKNWTVKICSWDHCRADDLIEFQKNHQNVSLMSLNDHWDDLVYHEYQAKSVSEEDLKNSIVLTLADGRFLKDEKIERHHRDWWHALERLCKWPVQYRWLKDRHLQLVFKDMPDSDTRQLGVQIKDKFLHVDRCETYPTFSKRLEKGPARNVHVTKKTYSEMVKR